MQGCVDIKTIIHEGKTIDDSKEMANIFNMYFAMTGSSLAAKITCANAPRPMLQCGTHFTLDPTTADEIQSIINGLREGAAGQDGISARVIKAISSHIYLPLSHIINLSFSAGTFPQVVKEAVVTPVHKCKSMRDVTNF